MEMENTSVALGKFEGVHLAHQKLLFSMKQYAENYNLKPLVFTFDPHPNHYFLNSFNAITTLAEKKMIFNQMGFEFVIYPFDEHIVKKSPQQFVEDILAKQFNCKAITVGSGFAFGKDRSGTCETLIEISKKLGIHVNVVPLMLDNGIKISSSNIRDLISKGQLQEAKRLLGRPYFILGSVVYGEQRGRTIGFPTVNIEANNEKLYPPNGVYATKTLYNGVFYKSVTNIGIKPTFGGTIKNIETHILGFNEYVYGKNIAVYFYERIRGEQKFENVSDLIEAVKKDIVFANNLE